MDVRDDGDAHGRTLAKALGLAALAAAWFVAAAVLWGTEVPDLSLPDLDPHSLLEDNLALDAEKVEDALDQLRQRPPRL